MLARFWPPKLQAIVHHLVLFSDYIIPGKPAPMSPFCSCWSICLMLASPPALAKAGFSWESTLLICCGIFLPLMSPFLPILSPFILLMTLAILFLSSSKHTTSLPDLPDPVSYTHLRAHETPEHLVCRLLLEKKKKKFMYIPKE
eukprot:TRINITY_DN1119_c0_g1_i4.p1 TRINITY_DN1119_c0_g1~~TRINITY_DN1119_c0_g1_i4.p1  ORF type:complete len:144 (+),score=30.05 TRINITY_DN1119_c0_g1_i4:365-796(+)